MSAYSTFLARFDSGDMYMRQSRWSLDLVYLVAHSSVSASPQEYKKFLIYCEMSSGKCFHSASLSRCGYTFMLRFTEFWCIYTFFYVRVHSSLFCGMKPDHGVLPLVTTGTEGSCPYAALVARAHCHVYAVCLPHGGVVGFQVVTTACVPVCFRL